MSISTRRLESYLWDAMSRVRGLASTRDTIEHIMGLLFLKRLSDQSLPEIGWDRIHSSPVPGDEITHALRTLESHPDYREVGELLNALGLSKLATKPRLCRELVEIISSTDLGGVTSKDLASLNTSFLEMRADAAGARSGEFYTPLNLSLLMAELLAPEAGATIYDPACGTGSLLLAAYRQSIHGAEGDSEPQLVGQEINLQTAALAKLNLILSGIPSASILTGNTLIEPRFLEGESIKQFDYAIAHPPVGIRLSRSDADYLRYDPYHRFVRFAGNVPRVADYAFIQHIVASLNERGRAVVLVGLRTLFVSGSEGQIRRVLIEDDVIEAVVTLCGNLLPNTSAPTAILILNKSKPEELKDKILFVYANEEYEPEDRRRNTISDHNRRRIVEAIKRQQEQDRFVVIATLEEIKANDYVLMPASYTNLIGIGNFMGGNFEWIELDKVADVLQGTRLGRQVSDAGATPVIQGRDLSVGNLSVDDLSMADVPGDLSNPVYTENGDILIQRIGQRPRAYLVEDELKGVLARDTVYVIRLHEKDPSVTRYLVEFLNSDIGQALLSTGVGGAVIPTMRLTDLRRLRLPIPDKVVIELINDLHEVEQTLGNRISRTRNLRRRLFGIEDPEQVEARLRSLSTEAQVLAASVVQVDDLDFQIRNFYPLPLAYPYRLLSAIREPTRLYPEQLRVAENILVFLGLVGLSFAAHTQTLTDPGNTNLTVDSLTRCWQGGISPGDWQFWANEAGKLLRENRELAVVNSFAALWFKGSGRKRSEFARLTKRLVELKNDFKHDRGPKAIYEFKKSAQEMDECLRQCLEQLSFFVQYPIRLVEHMDRDWETDKAILNTLVYVGDHPGLRQEQKKLADTLPENKLYLELTDHEWISLYPLISVQHCPDCKFRETYFIDRWDGPGERTILKSFERGHTHDNDDEARMVDKHFQHWLRVHFSVTGSD